MRRNTGLDLSMGLHQPLVASSGYVDPETEFGADLFDHWKADAAYVTARGGGSPSDGDFVQDWTGQVNSQSLPQSTQANQPTWKDSIQNGEPVIRFASASTQYLKRTGLSDPPDAQSIFIACSVAAITQSIVSWGNGATNSGLELFTLNPSFYGRKRDAVGLQDATVGWTTSFVILTLVTDGSTYIRIRKNGTTGTDDTYTASNPNTLSQLNIGLFNAGTSPMQGDVAELVIVNAEATGTSLTGTEDYLNAIYAAY